VTPISGVRVGGAGVPSSTALAFPGHVAAYHACPNPAPETRVSESTPSPTDPNPMGRPDAGADDGGRAGR